MTSYLATAGEYAGGVAGAAIEAYNSLPTGQEVSKSVEAAKAKISSYASSWSSVSAASSDAESEVSREDVAHEMATSLVTNCKSTARLAIKKRKSVAREMATGIVIRVLDVARFSISDAPKVCIKPLKTKQEAQILAYKESIEVADLHINHIQRQLVENPEDSNLSDKLLYHTEQRAMHAAHLKAVKEGKSVEADPREYDASNLQKLSGINWTFCSL